MPHFRMFLLSMVLVIILPSFTVGFPDKGIHGPNPEPLPNSPVRYTDRTHPADEVEGVQPADATLPYCDEVEADKPVEHIDPPRPFEDGELDKAGAKKIAKGVWQVAKEFVNMGLDWMKNHFKEMTGWGRSMGPPPKVPCLRRNLNQKG